MLTVSVKENEESLLKQKIKFTKEKLQFTMNIYDVNTSTLQITQRSAIGSLQEQINTAKLKMGYYVLEIIEGTQIQSIKFFKE